MTCGQKIRTLRQARGLLQRELGTLLGGVSQANIAAYEADAVQPSLGWLLRLTGVLGCSLAEFDRVQLPYRKRHLKCLGINNNIQA